MVTVTRDSVDATISVLLFMKAFSAGARRWFAQKWGGGSDLMLVRKERITCVDGLGIGPSGLQMWVRSYIRTIVSHICS